MQTAIVAEGGGQRGIFTAGVLDAFQQASFNPFDSGIGVSAGAQNLLAYFLEQQGYARRAIVDLTASFFYPPGVACGERYLVDGGVADPIPVERAYQQGARRILLLRTVPFGSSSVGWRERFDLIRRLRALPVSMFRMLGCHELASSRTAAFLSDPPSDLELRVVAPVEPLESQLLGSRPDALLHDYRAGWTAGLAAMQSLAAWDEIRQPPAIAGFPAQRIDLTPPCQRPGTV